MTANTRPEITILLLNYRRPANIPVILESIRRQTVTPVVFLWNNGADDVNLAGIDRYAGNGANLGCMARWRMALQADTPWIMSLDDDLCFARDDALESVLQALKDLDDPARIIGPAGCAFDGQKEYSQRRDIYAGYARTPLANDVNFAAGRDEPADMIKGRSMALRRDQLDGLVFPDEREDDIFLSAALANGRRKFHRVPSRLKSAFRELAELGVGNWKMPGHLDSRDRAVAKYFFPGAGLSEQAAADGCWRPRSLGAIHERHDNGLLVQLADGRGAKLNSTASLIWQLCDGKHTKAELLAELARGFDVPQSILQDALGDTLSQLIEIGALEPDSRVTERES